MRLYAFYDKLAQEHAPVFEAKSDAVARRVAQRTISAAEGVLLSDLELHFLGTFDEVSGKIDCPDTPQTVQSEFHDLQNNKLNKED